jgi:hypothetical protein
MIGEPHPRDRFTLKAGYVEIKNSTTVPLGTALTIEN